MSRSAKPQNGRRRFLRDVVRTAGGLAAVGVALGLQQQTARASGVRLRPPGAINENAFASACVRCGQCVQACPYDTLKLATLASGLSAGEATRKEIAPELAKLIKAMNEIGDVKEGDLVDFDFSGKTTSVLVNGKLVADNIGGKKLFDSVLRIWLGENAIDDKLKKSMLGL